MKIEDRYINIVCGWFIGQQVMRGNWSDVLIALLGGLGVTVVLTIVQNTKGAS